MNVIIIHPEEVLTEGRVELSDHRADHILNVLHGHVGQSLKVGLLHGRLGLGAVQDIQGRTVVLHCVFDTDPPEEPSIDVMLALPRPKVMRRLWAPLASLGIRRLFLTNAAKVERNYFNTHWLDPKHHGPLLIQGLEQAGDTRLPEVSIVRRLKPFVEDTLDALFPSGTRVLAHPSSQATIRQLHVEKNVLLALGPEGGWTDFEMALFEEHGFKQASFGQRTLRTDTACIALIAILKSALV